MRFKHLKLFGACSVATLLFCFDADGVNVTAFMKASAKKGLQTGDQKLVRVVQMCPGGDAIIAELRNNNAQNKSNSEKPKPVAQQNNNTNLNTLKINTGTNSNQNNPVKTQKPNTTKINNSTNNNNQNNQNGRDSKKQKPAEQPRNKTNNNQNNSENFFIDNGFKVFKQKGKIPSLANKLDITEDISENCPVYEGGGHLLLNQVRFDGNYQFYQINNSGILNNLSNQCGILALGVDKNLQKRIQDLVVYYVVNSNNEEKVGECLEEAIEGKPKLEVLEQQENGKIKYSLVSDGGNKTAIETIDAGKPELKFEIKRESLGNFIERIGGLQTGDAVIWNKIANIIGANIEIYEFFSKTEQDYNDGEQKMNSVTHFGRQDFDKIVRLYLRSYRNEYNSIRGHYTQLLVFDKAGDQIGVVKKAERKR